MQRIVKLSTLVTALLFNLSWVFSQEAKVVDVNKSTVENNDLILTVSPPKSGVPEIMPDVKADFQGGKLALNQFIAKNLKYPKQAIENGIQGVLVVGLKVTKDGTATFDKFIKQLGYGCEAEAKRLIKTMPKWNPAMLKGKPIDSNYTIMFAFKFVD
ncbi:energy transducer TonB [Sphingobacterium sp. BIGb0165]|uniref:energy transducer TonB n=1 Tax=Sphingobacterium sp. BIGb0165 TaxID=2940615 RepID=UPI002167D3BD|nr:energy transducer TonB [Sphingobacterium sp. BIGb0165]MCS4224630.1 protein TonB [Sphingobacterium sp. BIGb0165]